jgi:hypothetical protein|tara:strand:+ start:255 stop:434 length:180 start_codon:yes stop_codon:yes gene_type:complete
MIKTKDMERFTTDLNTQLYKHFEIYECIPLVFEWKGKEYGRYEFMPYVNKELKLWNINV